MTETVASADMKAPNMMTNCPSVALYVNSVCVGAPGKPSGEGSAGDPPFGLPEPEAIMMKRRPRGRCKISMADIRRAYL